MAERPDPRPIDLDAIASRYSLARMAGQAADDAGEGWDDAKIRAVLRSWQDIYPLVQHLRALTDVPAPPRHRGEG